MNEADRSVSSCELAVVLLLVLAFVVAANATCRAGCQRFHSDVNATSNLLNAAKISELSPLSMFNGVSPTFIAVM